MCKFITFMFIIGLRGTDFITIKNQTDLTVGISLYTTSAMSRSHTFTQMKCQLNYTLRWQWSCRPILYIVCISPANLSTVGIIYCIGCVKNVAAILRMRIRSDREKFCMAQPFKMAVTVTNVFFLNYIYISLRCFLNKTNMSAI